MARVWGWSGPSLAISASRTRSYSAIASVRLPAAMYATARLLSVLRVSGWSGPQLGDLGVADALEQRDRLGELAGVAVRQGEVVEHVQGPGVVGAQSALEPLGGRFCHLHDLRVAPPAVAEDVSQLTLGDVGFGRSWVALPCRIQQGPPLGLGLLPGRQSMVGLAIVARRAVSSSGWSANRRPTFSAARSSTSRSVTWSSAALLAGSAWVSRSWVRNSLIAWDFASDVTALSRSIRVRRSAATALSRSMPVCRSATTALSLDARLPLGRDRLIPLDAGLPLGRDRLVALDAGLPLGRDRLVALDDRLGPLLGFGLFGRDRLPPLGLGLQLGQPFPFGAVRLGAHASRPGPTRMSSRRSQRATPAAPDSPRAPAPCSA